MWNRNTSQNLVHQKCYGSLKQCINRLNNQQSTKTQSRWRSCFRFFFTRSKPGQFKKRIDKESIRSRCDADGGFYLFHGWKSGLLTVSLNRILRYLSHVIILCIMDSQRRQTKRKGTNASESNESQLSGTRTQRTEWGDVARAGAQIYWRDLK